MALIFSTFLWPPEPLLQYPCVRAQFFVLDGNVPSFSANFPSCPRTRIVQEGQQHLRGTVSNMENKKPIKKNHIKEFGGGNAPEASRG